MNPRRLRPVGSAFQTILAVSLVLFCLASDLPGQQTEPDTYAGFDGQSVSGVEISAASSVDTQAIRSLIQQEPDQAFSNSAIRRSVAALQQTGQFTSVKVNVQPQAKGLRVVFVLEPADYIGVVNFVGTGTITPYTALLQSANIPEQSPFYPTLVDDARNGVVEYLHKLGYFQAQVRGEVNHDNQRHIANITFVCTLHQQAKIRNIEFDGLSPEQSSSIRSSLRDIWARLRRVTMKTGQRYTEARTTKAIPFISEHLRTANRLTPSIRLASVSYEVDSNTVDIRYDVTAGPRATVAVNGAHVSSKTIRRLVPIYQEGSVDQDLIEEGRGNLQDYFQSKGYFDAVTKSRREQNGDTVAVVYDVSLDGKHRVTAITFVGNRHFSDKQLTAHVSIKKAFPIVGHGQYSEQLLTKSVNSLMQLYRDAGFSGIAIQPQTTDVGSRVAVTLRISEGAQEKVASLQVTGNRTQTLADLTRKYHLRLQPGNPFSPQLLETDRAQLLAAYLDLGYLRCPGARPTVCHGCREETRLRLWKGAHAGPGAVQGPRSECWIGPCAYQTADFGVTSRPLGASADFVRFLGQTAFYKPVKPWLVWANNFRLGFARSFSGSDVPLSEEFFSGGADSLRGFPINGAGPQRPLPVCSNPASASTCTLISVPVGGNMLFIVNSEARFPLPISFKHQGLDGVVFYDGGNVYANISLRQFADNFTHSVGLGLRYQTPVGPIRFDVAYRLTSIPGVSAIQYFVTLGQSF